MQLYMQPAGPVLQGDTVNIICRVTDKHLLDIVRLVRHPLNNDTRHSDVITTNGVMEGRFKVMSRYKVVDWNESQGVIALQITGETDRKVYYEYSLTKETNNSLWLLLSLIKFYLLFTDNLGLPSWLCGLCIIIITSRSGAYVCTVQ